jgi:hypothetical protein
MNVLLRVMLLLWGLTPVDDPAPRVLLERS